MALSNAQIRAIAIKRSIARKANPVAANDNVERRATRRAAKPNGMLQASIDAAGFEQHASHGA